MVKMTTRLPFRLLDARSLAGLIDIYEGNYFRVMRLVPELDGLDGTVVSRVAGALDLYLTMNERTRYTTTITLTYQFPDEGGFVPEPNARICIYHDVRAAAVLRHCRRNRAHAPDPRWSRGKTSELDRKWELNRFLQKWLGFCYRQGHLFLSCTSRPARTPVAFNHSD